MPGVAAPVEGVFNLRGTLITVVRASGPADSDIRESTGSPWCVVVQWRDGRVGLGVDEVIDYQVPGPGIPTFDAENFIEAALHQRVS
jgi:chemotaxis signal transduction protein